MKQAIPLNFVVEGAEVEVSERARLNRTRKGVTVINLVYEPCIYEEPDELDVAFVFGEFSQSDEGEPKECAFVVPASMPVEQVTAEYLRSRAWSASRWPRFAPSRTWEVNLNGASVASFLKDQGMEPTRIAVEYFQRMVIAELSIAKDRIMQQVTSRIKATGETGMDLVIILSEIERLNNELAAIAGTLAFESQTQKDPEGFLDKNANWLAAISAHVSEQTGKLTETTKRYKGFAVEALNRKGVRVS